MKLAWNTVLIACAVALSLPMSTARAQDRGDDGQTGEDAGSTPGRRGKSAPRAQAPVSVVVEGVPAESVTSLLTDLRALTQDVYACPTCKDATRHAGTCAQCSTELVKTGTSPVVARVEIAVDRRYLSITLNPHHWMSIADIDELLSKVGAKARRDQFRLPDNSRLEVTAAAGADAARVRAALIDLKVLPAVTVVPDPDSDAVWVMPRSGKESVTVAAIEAGLAKMSGEYRVTDVQWATFCPACGVRPTIEMGDPTCRAN